jgi:peptidoglycan hydrolase-like protein with peptidoglycan-binding domain
MTTKASEGELQSPGEIERGDHGGDVKRVQEWLCLHEIHVGIDKDFGPATETAVKQFQSENNLPSNGVVTSQHLMLSSSRCGMHCRTSSPMASR